MSAVNEDAIHLPEQLVDQLLKGYDSLTTEIRLLDEQRRQLENKVSWSKQQVRRLFLSTAFSCTNPARSRREVKKRDQ
jgi:hypothetical protein